MTLTRRDFLATSGGALALTAVALAWPSGRAGAAVAPAGDSASVIDAGLATSSGAIERQRRFRDGALRPAAWSRAGGAYRVALRDAEHVEITTPHRGRAVVRLDDRRARDAIARELSPGVLREVLAEAERQRTNAVSTA
jgi:hypothetical protein